MGRRSLHEEIVGEIRNLILDGELKPGSKIAEPELCERLDVSRTPLREALKALSVEGLVTLRPNRGACVAVVTKEQIDELLPVMGALEQLGGVLLCKSIADAPDRDAILRDLEALHEEIAAGYEARDPARYRKANKTFHEQLIAFGGNGSLLEIYRIVLARMHMGRFLVEKSETDWQLAMQDHRMIIEAIRAGDGERTGALLRHHAEATARIGALNALDRSVEGAAN